MTYSRDAFKCHRCPKKQEGGCPAWAELVERNTATQEVRPRNGCVFSMLPHLLMHGEHASNHVAAEMSAMRGAMVTGVRDLVASAADETLSLGAGEH